jgi:uncharacterized membrane protein YdjX (TVP38/TMEM64 family)
VTAINQTKYRLQIIVLAVFILCILLAYLFNLQRYLSFDMLKQHRQSLLQLVSTHYVIASIIYILSYIVIVTFSLPGATFMSITGGFLFGLISGTVYVVVGATIGAIFLFLLARFVIADFAKEKAGPWLQKMEKGFKKNALNYMLVLRLIPLFPFFIVNLAAAVLGIPLRTYMLATFFGIIPGTFVYVSVGTGLGSIFDRGETFTGKGLLTPQIIIALCGLAFLAILPVIYKKIKKKEQL